MTLLAVFGKFFITMSYGIIYNWACEIYPTEVRNSCLGASAMAGCLGGFLAPYMAQMVCTLFHHHTSKLELPFISKISE